MKAVRRAKAWNIAGRLVVGTIYRRPDGVWWVRGLVMHPERQPGGSQPMTAHRNQQQKAVRAANGRKNNA